MATPVNSGIEPAAALFADLGKLWDKAKPEERTRLLGPLLDRVYIDIKDRHIAAICPAPAFKALIDHAVDQSPSAKCVIVRPDQRPQDEDWSVWWRRGRVELPVQRGFREGFYERVR